MTRASLILSAVLATSTVARAQPAPANPPADAAYQEARRLYDLREWDAAIGKFKEAYRLRPDAPSLFNIAQSNRLKGDCAEALSFYKTYKRNFPAEKNIDKVDKFIADMETCVKAGPVKVDPTKTTPLVTDPTKTTPVVTDPTKTTPLVTDPTKTTPLVTDPAKTTPSDPTRPDPSRMVMPPKDPGKNARLAGAVVGGVGVLGLGATIFFGLRAHSAANDAESGKQGATWNPGIQTRGETAARNGKISFVVGTACLATGVVLYMMGRKRSAEASNIALVPSHDGGALVWGSDF